MAFLRFLRIAIILELGLTSPLLWPASEGEHSWRQAHLYWLKLEGNCTPMLDSRACRYDFGNPGFWRPPERGPGPFGPGHAGVRDLLFAFWAARLGAGMLRPGIPAHRTIADPIAVRARRGSSRLPTGSTAPCSVRRQRRH